ncbi:WD40-repeat-containing domain protein [Flagelloscypha sp. PMI_526]|nr:WD40-repeat-containing domain protein [Flagelloscypha sp. PMI_526]
MPDTFFASDKPRKRKRTTAQSTPDAPSAKKMKRKGSKQNIPSAPKKRVQNDSSEDSDDGDLDDLDLRHSEPEDSSGDEDMDETPAEKRLRLAKMYLDSLKQDFAEGDFDAADVDRDIINSRLKQDVLEHSGKVHLFIADKFFSSSSPPDVQTLELKKGHRLPLTSIAFSSTGNSLWSSGKEGSIIKWDPRTGKKLRTIHKAKKANGEKGVLKGHTDEVLALAVSGDDRYLVSSGRDKKIVVWEAESMEMVKEFYGPLAHRDTIGGLVFRHGTNQLYSASFDRTIKIYDLSPSVMGYVETLFGHQDSILSVDALRGETCVSVGGRDKTVRYWKVHDETQLVFRGGGKAKEHKGDKSDSAKAPSQDGEGFVEGSLECVAMVDEHTFLSGGDSGTISLWSMAKKKPIFAYPLAHGYEIQEIVTIDDEDAGTVRKPRWITSLASLRYSDLFASGSYSSSINIYKLSSLSNIPGVINSLRFLSPPRTFWESQDAWWRENSSLAPSYDVAGAAQGAKPLLLAVAVGQEHRLGRWLKLPAKDADSDPQLPKPKNHCRIMVLFPTRT